MGADIYLRSVNGLAKAEWQPKFHAAVALRDARYPRGGEGTPEQPAVDEAYEAMYASGYFRDSYNATALLGLLGMSWWAAARGPDEQGWEIDENREMPIESMRAFRNALLAREVTDADMVAWETENRSRATIEPTGENGVAGWRAWFEGQRLRLIALLEQAIALGEPLYCSV